MTKKTRFNPVVMVNQRGDYVSKFGGEAESWSEIVQAGMMADFVVTSADELTKVARRLKMDGFTKLKQTEVPEN